MTDFPLYRSNSWILIPCAAQFMEQKGRLRSSIQFFSRLTFEEPFFIISVFFVENFYVILKLFNYKLPIFGWIWHHKRTCIEIQMFPFSRFIVWNGGMCKICLLKAWDAPVIIFWQNDADSGTLPSLRKNMPHDCKIWQVELTNNGLLNRIWIIERIHPVTPKMCMYVSVFILYMWSSTPILLTWAFL